MCSRRLPYIPPRLPGFPDITPGIAESFDPNHLIPPASVGLQGWMPRDQVLQFTIQLENDPDFHNKSVFNNI